MRNIVGTKGGPTDVVIEDTVRRYFKGAVDRVSNGREKRRRHQEQRRNGAEEEPRRDGAEEEPRMDSAEEEPMSDTPED